jgi:predicted nicotinamide N-methyase
VTSLNWGEEAEINRVKSIVEGTWSALTASPVASASVLEATTEDTTGREETRAGWFDMIVATDVVFQHTLMPPLLATIEALIGSKTVVWMCIQVRDPVAYRLALVITAFPI